MRCSLPLRFVLDLNLLLQSVRAVLHCLDRILELHISKNLSKQRNYIRMLSSLRRTTRPLSVRRIININMSGGASSSSVKRKRDNPGDTRPDSKAPKRASEL
jgi:hypothetical protein